MSIKNNEYQKALEKIKEYEYMTKTENDLAVYLLVLLERKDFKKNVLPLVKELYKLDNINYNMLKTIGDKLSRESDLDAYKLQYDGFKKELHHRINKSK